MKAAVMGTLLILALVAGAPLGQVSVRASAGVDPQQVLSEAIAGYSAAGIRQAIAQLEAVPENGQTAATLLMLGRGYEHLAELALLEDKKEAERLAEIAVTHLRASLSKGETSLAYSAIAHCYQIMTFARKLNGMRLGPKTSGAIKKALALDSSNPQALLLEAQGFLDAPSMFGGDVAKAVDILNGMSRQFPESDQVFYHLGRAYVKAKDTSRAKKALEQALKLNPRNPFARRLLGQLN